MIRKVLSAIILCTCQVVINAQCWQTIESGNNHCYSIRSNGTLWAWGDNELGVLGDSSSNDQTKPIQLGNSNQWKTISANDHHALGIHGDGTLWGWGDNNAGVFGNGTTVTRIKPFQISTATYWREISAGEYFSLAIKTDGTLWAWGGNSFGQLGNGTNDASTVPLQVGSASNWIMISAGRNHCLALNSSGELWSWGDNLFGEIGAGQHTPFDEVSTPLKLAGTWKYISAGVYCSFGIKTDGSLWGWGINGYGQINGSGNDVFGPAQIGSGLTWVSVTASEGHVAALKADGTIWTWGRNNYGQLGDGTKTNGTSGPVQLGNASDWKYILAAKSSTLALKTNGTLYAWGWNNNGQQGDGTKVDKITPTQVICETSSVEKTEKNADYTLYPNPLSSSYFIIHVNNPYPYQVLDLCGKNMLSGNLISGENNIELPPNVTHGIYFIQIGNATQKLIINP